ncbi:PP2C family protein-serine/threonine phosphatase [Solitalea canadensis]|uniref:Serine phosphatase RsbU, regulator of sigma subunit n=1 Tax=Solitalea canadensis (strain ATCC 29591 / DSM 3403 / JCM 21819 / LMG 8368 / NBRC 15130 / NCIMB 12057 / USAM 9D) TaxID=929556 RepID=H8KWQ6_SOLCM|nr:PP2C family protein-serine/threonine phosphatase [Solitalea canadensis]AFD08235.1 serine phosphatase RsbU, regulator of sigma subunit [Solitalea canadensis DSM 3403]
MNNETNQEILELLIRRQVELNSLLEITRAINNNNSIDSLFQMTELILKNQLRIGKLRVFSRGEDSLWTQPASYGVEKLNEEQEADLTAVLAEYKIVTYINSVDSQVLSEFRLLIPVEYKEQIYGYVLIGDYLTREFDQVDIDVKLIQTIINVIIVAAENRRLLEERILQERLQRDLRLAVEVQSMLFPRSLPDNEKISMSARYVPQHNIGGDYYDFLELNKNEFIFCIADVSGKGVSAALLMANFQASLRALAFQKLPLNMLLSTVNKAIFALTEGDRHITLFLGHYDLSTRKLTYVNAGHNPSLLINNLNIKELKSGTTMIGVFEDLPFINVGEEIIEPNSLVFNYTDGLVELDHDHADLFSETDLINFVFEHQNLKPEKINIALMDKIKKLIGNDLQDDDITLLTFRVY